MVAMLSLFVSMYKWEQQHLEAENLAEEYIYTCREERMETFTLAESIKSQETN